MIHEHVKEILCFMFDERRCVFYITGAVWDSDQCALRHGDSIYIC